MSADPDYDFWEAGLIGRKPELPDRGPQCGRYRHTGRNGTVPIAIWRNGEKDIVAKVGDGQIVEADDTWCERWFATACRHPITEQTYLDVRSGKPWPDDVALPARNTNAPPEVQVAETIAELRAEAEAWLASIGGQVLTQEHADKVANYANRFIALAKEAESSHKVEKAEFLKGGRAIDAKWKPLETAAENAKAWVADLSTAFLQAEKARKLEEAVKAAADGQYIHPAKLTVKAGTQGRGLSLRTKKVGEIEDYDAFIGAVKDWQEVRAFYAGLANRIARGTNAVPVPGIKITEIQKAA